MNTYQLETIRRMTRPDPGSRARLITRGCLVSVLVGLVGYSWVTGLCRAQEADKDAQGVQVLTRGPVHEAFAGMVTFNPAPGVIVQKAPPNAIEEVPPGERPEGTNVTWIPGYWAWDDERSDFLWVSGTWRALPPGRAWVAGYWGKITEGYQWTSGYWANAAQEETTYLPAPPATVEEGPSTKAPSRDYGWTPGSWLWRDERYAWSPGYWAQGRADWDWMPSHYVWTPRGYVFVDGYWDYSVNRRGMLFAPVYFDSGLSSRSGYSYSPSIVLDLALLAENLFLRPNYHHYYFGDYYDNSYNQGGYFAAYAYQSNRSGYDPIFSHQLWMHRQDQNWAQSAATTYQYRRDHVDARPPRTWSAMRAIDPTTAAAKQNHLMVATPIDQLSKRKGGAVRLQAVTKQDRQTLALRGTEVQKSRDERRALEATGAGTAALKPGETAVANHAKMSRSPIVGSPVTQLKKNQTPPALQKSPAAKLIEQPGAGNSATLPHGDKGNLKPESRKTEVTPRDTKIQPESRKTEVTPRDTKIQPEFRKTEVTPRDTKIQPEPEHRTKEAPVKVHDQPERSSRGSEKNIQRNPDQPSKSRSSPGGNEEDKSDKKDHKKG